MCLALGHTIRLFVMKSRSRPPATSVHLPGTFRAFRDSNYRLLWPANVLAYSSRWMQMTLLGWLVLELTDSELRVALVGVFAMAPMLLLWARGRDAGRRRGPQAHAHGSACHDVRRRSCHVRPAVDRLGTFLARVCGHPGGRDRLVVRHAGSTLSVPRPSRSGPE